MKAAVIGFPISHSLSPTIHGYWLEKYGVRGSYEAIAITPEELYPRLNMLMDAGYTGFNVTIPHKQAVMALCDEIEDTARQIGAVNTLALDRAGRVRGLNTDAEGFMLSVEEEHPGFEMTAGPALVLGAGGASRAVIYSLKNRGVKTIRVANRTMDKTQILARDFGIEVVPWDDRLSAARDVNFLVNTTALGMKGQGALDFDVKSLPRAALVCDIVYIPQRTALLEDAAAQGNRIVEGLGMLLHQARLAFAAWTGIMPGVTPELRTILLEKLKNRA